MKEAKKYLAFGVLTLTIIFSAAILGLTTYASDQDDGDRHIAGIDSSLVQYLSDSDDADKQEPAGEIENTAASAEDITNSDVSNEKITQIEAETAATEAIAEPAAFTQEEIEILAHLAMAEAEGESLEGKIAVINVVQNRSRNRGMSIADVVFAPSQFCTGSRFNLTPSAQCYEAVEAAMSGTMVISDDVEYFCEKSIHFNYLEFVCQIGNHKFFREY